MSERVRPPRTVACKPIDPNFKSAMDRFDQAVNSPSETLEPIIVSVILRDRLSPDDRHGPSSARGGSDGPSETIRDLVLEVRANPARLATQRAANKAGYSPFHFSRVFKNLVGYGSMNTSIDAGPNVR